MNVTLDTGGSTLMAVPARHYCSPFAREVNRLCSDEDSRPEAIAVELGPLMTRELARWMAELGTGPGKKSPLPCMLGILVSNRLIDVSKRNTALFLQEYYSVGLSEVDPEILRELLDFAGDHLMCLSATDSMIEAIRCALEYGIPLFGVDLEEFVRGPGFSHPLTEEPGYGDFDLARFVAINEPAAVRARDARADQRRETAMAARLKKLLSQFNRVLFTCGLAHWGSIRALLHDPALRPADLLPSFTPSLPKDHRPPSFSTPACRTGGLMSGRKSDLPSSSYTPAVRRVIVHPTMAMAFMDTFPIMTTLYENARNPPDLHAESG
ncbi:MAG TPA: hypothetical protein PLX49_13190, partial [Prolixibacteraceae bacterium]|nr:hypothetical protein [Prolixibacteraceae bacterium]